MITNTILGAILVLYTFNTIKTWASYAWHKQQRLLEYETMKQRTPVRRPLDGDLAKRVAKDGPP